MAGPDRGWQRVRKAMGYSMAGLRVAFAQEAAFRQLLVLNGALIALSFALELMPVERALLVAVCMLSIVVELINSAIEKVVDRISLERHELSKNAKDLGSAAQWVALCTVALVWAIVLVK